MDLTRIAKNKSSFGEMKEDLEMYNFREAFSVAKHWRYTEESQANKFKISKHKLAISNLLVRAKILLSAISALYVESNS